MKAERLHALLGHVRKPARSGSSSCLAAALETEGERKQALHSLEKGRSKFPTHKKKKAAADAPVDSDGFPQCLPARQSQAPHVAEADQSRGCGTSMQPSSELWVITPTLVVDGMGDRSLTDAGSSWASKAPRQT